MKLCNCREREFMKRIKGKKIICFGAGITSRFICENFIEEGILDQIVFFVDNDSSKWGTFIKIGEKNCPICSPKAIEKYDANQYVFFITTRFWDEVYLQLNNNSKFQDIECYIYILFKAFATESNDLSNTRIGKRLIPKTIHYCWFGENELPPLAQRCIESWKYFCPDYEIIQWNMNNYDVNKKRFTCECVGHHWSALASYARLDILNQYGGIYMDVDVEMVKSFDDLLYHDAFMGFEVSNYVNTGHGFGAKKGLDIFLENMEEYDKRSFLNSEGKWHDYIPSPILTTEVLKKHGLKTNGQMQSVDNVTVYPSDYFDPAMQIPGSNTYSVHRYSSLWSFSGKDMEEIWEKQRKCYFNIMEKGEVNA